MQGQHSLKPRPDLWHRGSNVPSSDPPRGLLARLRRVLTHAMDHAPRLMLEVDAELFARLRRAARARRSSPQLLAHDLLARGLDQETLRAHTETVLRSLTPREAEVVWRAARGHTNRQIAEALVISPETVKTHVRNILHKLGLHSKADLRLLMLDLGLRWWQDE